MMATTCAITSTLQLSRNYAENILQLGSGEINEAVDIADTLPLFGPPRAPAMSDRKPVEKFRSKKIEKLWICFYNLPGGAGGSTRVLFL